jgi:DNA-binding NarL/FixJ family response regulator
MIIMSKILFAIFEKSFIIRQGLISAIEEYTQSELLSEYSTIEQFILQIKNNRPQIIIINQEFRQSISDDILIRLKNELDFLIIELHKVKLEYKDYFIDELIDFDEEKLSIKQKLLALVAKIKTKTKVESNDHELSRREKDVVALIAKGRTNKEIADGLFISVHTAMTHRKNIVRKLGIKTVSGITVYAILNKLIDMKDLN